MKHKRTKDNLKDGFFLKGAEVELLQRGINDWYCQVQHGNDVGWLACDWLVEK